MTILVILNWSYGSWRLRGQFEPIQATIIHQGHIRIDRGHQELRNKTLGWEKFCLGQKLWLFLLFWNEAVEAGDFRCISTLLKLQSTTAVFIECYLVIISKLEVSLIISSFFHLELLHFPKLDTDTFMSYSRAPWFVSMKLECMSNHSKITITFTLYT